MSVLLCSWNSDIEFLLVYLRHPSFLGIPIITFQFPSPPPFLTTIFLFQAYYTPEERCNRLLFWLKIYTSSQSLHAKYLGLECFHWKSHKTVYLYNKACLGIEIDMTMCKKNFLPSLDKFLCRQAVLLTACCIYESRPSVLRSQRTRPCGGFVW